MNVHDAEDSVSIRHQRGCTVVVFCSPHVRGRVILRGVFRTLSECLAAVDAGVEVRAITRL